MKLNDTWVLWVHYPHDNDWTIESYKKLITFNTLEDAISIIEFFKINILEKYLLFIMRDGILPIWEDKNNVKGGCFSYKVPNEHINDIWKQMSYLLIGETITKDVDNINGITLSNKKKFFILKIWTKTTKNIEPDTIHSIKNLNEKKCVFKEHSIQ